jgi:hypothetical protein
MTAFFKASRSNLWGFDPETIDSIAWPEEGNGEMKRLEQRAADLPLQMRQFLTLRTAPNIAQAFTWPPFWTAALQKLLIG